MEHTFLTVSENPHLIRGKVNQFDKVERQKKEDKKNPFKWQKK